MAPKKDKKKKEDADPKENEDRDLDRDEELKAELDKLNQEVEDSKKRLGQLKDENEWLEEEAQKINEESQEYLSFMSKKANMRQNSIITLSDHNKKEIEEIKSQKENVIKDFEAKKLDLQNNLINKQNLLNKVKSEIEEMSEYKELKQSQLAEIELLEKEIVEVRSEQTKIINELRTEFLKEKAEHKKDSENRIESIVKAANREARSCLSENTLRIKMENQKLRTELLGLIQQSKVLNEHKEKLEKQKSELMNEIKYAEDLKKIRSTRQTRVVKKLFPNGFNYED